MRKIITILLCFILIVFCTCSCTPAEKKEDPDTNINTEIPDKSDPNKGEDDDPNAGDKNDPNKGEDDGPNAGDKNEPNKGEDDGPSTGDKNEPNKGEDDGPNAGDKNEPNKGEDDGPNAGDKNGDNVDATAKPHKYGKAQDLFKEVSLRDINGDEKKEATEITQALLSALGVGRGLADGDVVITTEKGTRSKNEIEIKYTLHDMHGSVRNSENLLVEMTSLGDSIKYLADNNRAYEVSATGSSAYKINKASEYMARQALNIVELVNVYVLLNNGDNVGDTTIKYAESSDTKYILAEATTFGNVNITAYIVFYKGFLVASDYLYENNSSNYRYYQAIELAENFDVTIPKTYNDVSGTPEWLTIPYENLGDEIFDDKDMISAYNDSGVVTESKSKLMSLFNLMSNTGRLLQNGFGATMDTRDILYTFNNGYTNTQIIVDRTSEIYDIYCEKTVDNIESTTIEHYSYNEMLYEIDQNGKTKYDSNYDALFEDLIYSNTDESLFMPMQTLYNAFAEQNQWVMSQFEYNYYVRGFDIQYKDVDNFTVLKITVSETSFSGTYVYDANGILVGMKITISEVWDGEEPEIFELSILIGRYEVIVPETLKDAKPAKQGTKPNFDYLGYEL